MWAKGQPTHITRRLVSYFDRIHSTTVRRLISLRRKFDGVAPCARHALRISEEKNNRKSSSLLLNFHFLLPLPTACLKVYGWMQWWPQSLCWMLTDSSSRFGRQQQSRESTPPATRWQPPLLCLAARRWLPFAHSRAQCCLLSSTSVSCVSEETAKTVELSLNSNWKWILTHFGNNYWFHNSWWLPERRESRQNKC